MTKNENLKNNDKNENQPNLENGSLKMNNNDKNINGMWLDSEIKKYANGLTISKIENGKTKNVKWDMISNENQLPHDFFKDSDENVNPDYENYENVKVEFNPNKSYARLPYVVFKLENAYKTIGTYITKMNKIANGINPYDKKSYSTNAKNTTNDGTHGIKKIDNDTIKIFNLKNNENYAILKYINPNQWEIEIFGDFNQLSYYIECITQINKWENRIDQLIQYDENDKKCENPKYILKYNDEIQLTIGDTKPENLKPYYKQLVQTLIENDIYQYNLKDCKILKIGGGKKWLKMWLYDKNLMVKNRPIT